MQKSKNIVEREGFSYRFDPSVCLECEGVCCRGESGYIWVKYAEMEQIAGFLNLSIEDFAKIYLRKVKHRYSLVEKKIGESDYACIFLMKK